MPLHIFIVSPSFALFIALLIVAYGLEVFSQLLPFSRVLSTTSVLAQTIVMLKKTPINIFFKGSGDSNRFL